MIIGIIIIAAILAFWDFAGVIIIAGSFSVFLLPAHRYLCRYMRGGFSSAILTTAVAVGIVVAVYVAAIVLYDNIDYLMYLINSILWWLNNELFSGVSGFGEKVNPLPWISDFFRSSLDDMRNYLISLLVMAPMVLIKVMILFLSIFLFLLFGEKIYAEIEGILPEESLSTISIMRDSVVDMLYALFNVHIAVGLAVFFIAFPVFYILGYEHIMFYAVISGILALIPIFGPVILIAFLVLYAVSVSDWYGLAIIIVVAWPLLCAIPDWWMRPVLMGKRTSINSVIMFIAFFGGIAAMGILGFIMGPIFIALLIGCYRILLHKFGDKQDVSSAL
ncbi:AI-2E family transporter [Methanoplanus limicola]|uniref:AI-2E family transporter n=1 Tax=Methanoplanus limicola TaxID=2315 RepID=UPI001FDF1575|nr:AI-2E family transporter [Methanoplanus limicola]